ncbi:MAG: methyl-accepting chemotaxis protein [Myxococcota bacterium]
MPTDPRITAFTERAAAALTPARAAPDDAPSFTVVLFGRVQGAVHVFVPPEITDAALERFSRELISEAGGAGFDCRALWHGRTRGPHRGERLGGLVFEVQHSGPVKEHTLHVNQSITAAQELTEKSVMAIGEEMRGIWELARTQANGLRNIAAQFSNTEEAKEHANVASTIDQLSAQMRAFGQEILERTQRQARDIEQARAWTNDIVKLGQAISAIASNARLLTFNARLESARIGEAGRGFAVIAGSIQELATQVRQTNNSVAQLAQNLAASLPRLNADAMSTAQTAEVQVAQIEAQLIEVQGHITEMRTESFQALSESSTAAAQLQQRADEVLTHLQFQDRASQMLTEARQQALAALAAAGLSQGELSDAELAQVGALGRALGKTTEDSQPAGSVLVF